MLWCWVWVGQVQEGLLEVVVTHWILMDGKWGSETWNTQCGHQTAALVIHQDKREGRSEKWTRKGRQGPNQHGALSQDVRRLR